MALLQLFSAPKHLLFTILLDTLLSFFEVSCFSFSVNVFNAAISLFLHVTLHVFWTYFKLLSGLCSLLVLPLLPFSLFYTPIYIYYKWCHFFLGKKKDNMRCICISAILLVWHSVLHQKYPSLQRSTSFSSASYSDFCLSYPHLHILFALSSFIFFYFPWQ